jgi:hypothetical protein
MKISLKLANGATLDFEGDPADFDRISAFLADPPESLSAEPPEATTAAIPSRDLPAQAKLPTGSLDPAAVLERLERVGANNDQERMTVMAQRAVETGKEGVDYPTLRELYTELGFPKPAQFPTKTLANAKNSGLVKLVKQGIWRPTFRGENFASGHGRGERVPRRSAPRPKSSNDNRGGESD